MPQQELLERGLGARVPFGIHVRDQLMRAVHIT
jgi:hypothetical protein